MRKLWYAVVTIVALGAGSWALFPATHSETKSANSASGVASADATDPISTSRQPPNSGNASIKESSHQKSLQNQFDRSEHLRDFVESQLDNAKAGDGQAARLIAYAYEECKQITSDPTAYAESLKRIVGQQLTADQKLLFDGAMKREATRCGGLNDEDSSKASVWFLGAAANGDVVSELRASLNSMKPSSITEAMKAGIESQDGAAIAEIGTALTNLSDAERQQIGGMFTKRLGSPAWSLAACDFGMDCSQSGQTLRNICIRIARCDFASLADAYASLYSPIDFQEIQQERNAITTAIKSNDLGNIFGE